MKTRFLFITVAMLFINTTAFSEDVVYVLHSTNQAYIPGMDSGISTVTMLRNETFATLKTLTLPTEGATDIAVTPDKSRLWVASQGDLKVYVIGAESLEIADTISFGIADDDFSSYGPNGVAFSPDGSLAYVTNTVSGGSRSSVVVYNTETLARITSIGIWGYPYLAVLNPDGTRVYVFSRVPIDWGDGHGYEVTVLDTSDYTAIATVGPLDGYLVDAVISPDGSHIFASNTDANQIEIIRTSVNELLAPIPTQAEPRGIGISPDGNYLFVGHNAPIGSVDDGGTMNMLRLSDQTVVSSVAIRRDPRSVVVTENGDRIFVADWIDDKVYGVDVNGEDLTQKFVTDPDFSNAPEEIVLGVYPSPVPDIKINGSDGPLTLTASDTLQLALRLNNNGRTEFADWWLAGDSPYGFLFWTPATGWTYDQRPAYKGRLYFMRDFRSPILPVGGSGPRDDGLAPGKYTLYFGVDVLRDGFISWPYLYVDSIEVGIVP